MADLDARWSSARSAQAEEGGGAMLTGIAEVTGATAPAILPAIRSIRGREVKSRV